MHAGLLACLLARLLACLLGVACFSCVRAVLFLAGKVWSLQLPVVVYCVPCQSVLGALLLSFQVHVLKFYLNSSPSNSYSSSVLGPCPKAFRSLKDIPILRRPGV